MDYSSYYAVPCTKVASQNEKLHKMTKSELELEKDRIFAGSKLPGDFIFDEQVAQVFEDMINRSVPGYSTIIAMIGELAEKYCQAQSNIYDLGSSLGAASLAMANRISCENYQIIAVDNSQAMVDKFEAKLASLPIRPPFIQCRHGDVLEIPIERASVVVLNFTLQFIPLEQRKALLQNIYQAMLPGGILIISEKIQFPDIMMNELFIEMYHSFKESMGYSKLDISQKRAALENVLLPETLEAHRSRLDTIGFDAVDVWFQCFNFASMVAFKQVAFKKD